MANHGHGGGHQGQYQAAAEDQLCVFGLIFILICLVSAFFSCIVGVIGTSRKPPQHHNYKEEDLIIPMWRYVDARKYSEESSSNSNILY
jgi:hypothetical protein